MPSKHWTILIKKDVSPSPWYTIEHHCVKLPNGLTVDDYYVSLFPPAVMVLPFTKHNSIVLVQQYKHGIGTVITELPAGAKQQDKSLEESAIAELEEETGISTTINNLESLGKVGQSPTKSNATTYGYLARNLEFNSVQQLEVTEDITVLERSPKEVLQMVKNGDIWIGDSVTFIMRAYLQFPQLFKS